MQHSRKGSNTSKREFLVPVTHLNQGIAKTIPLEFQGNRAKGLSDDLGVNLEFEAKRQQERESQDKVRIQVKHG